MTSQLVLAAGSGIVLALGLVAIARGLVGGPEPTRARPSFLRRDLAPVTRRRNRTLLAGLAVGLVVFALTGWFAALVVGPIVAWGVPLLLQDPVNRDIELLAALDRWVRALAAMLPTGKSVQDAIRASSRTAPPLLADEVRLVTARLDERWSTRDALRAMADRLDSPDSDAVMAALMLTSLRGGTGATASLSALSESITDRLRALREIEAERDKPRVVVRQVTVISIAVLALFLVIGRDFFTPYTSGVGQVILATLCAAYVGSLVMMRRIATPVRRRRILRDGGTA